MLCPVLVLNLKFILKSLVLGVSFKPWGYLDIHAEKEIFGERVILASGIVQPGEVDPGGTFIEGMRIFQLSWWWFGNWNRCG